MKRNIFKIALFIFLFTALAVSIDIFLIGELYRVEEGEVGAWNKIRRGGIDADILVSGDSRAIISVECYLMEKHTGMSCMNISMNGNLFDIQYARFKMYLKYNKQPKILIQVLGRSTLAQSEPYSPIQFLPYLHEQELYTTLMKTKRKDIFIKAKYIPLYGLSYLRTIRSLNIYTDLYFSREIRVKGFYPDPTKWSLSEEKFQELHQEGIDWELEPAQVAQLEELSKYCKDKGIKLVLVVPPMYMEGRKLLTGKKEMLHTYNALADRLDALYLSYFDHPLTENRDYFYNFQHTNIFGAKVFSKALGKDIATYLKNIDR